MSGRRGTAGAAPRTRGSPQRPRLCWAGPAGAAAPVPALRPCPHSPHCGAGPVHPALCTGRGRSAVASHRPAGCRSLLPSGSLPCPASPAEAPQPCSGAPARNLRSGGRGAGGRPGPSPQAHQAPPPGPELPTVLQVGAQTAACLCLAPSWLRLVHSALEALRRGPRRLKFMYS